MQDPTNVVGQRVGAFIIDLILLTIVNFAVFFAMAEKTSEIVLKEDFDLDTTLYGNVTIGDDEYALYGGRWLAYIAIMCLVWFLYWVLLQGLTGWTPGKKLLGIRTVDENGRVAGIGRTFIRQILWIADSFPWIVPYLTGFILALVTKGHRRLGDLAAKTFVVKANALGQAPLQPGFAGQAPAFPQQPQQFAPQPPQQFQPPPQQFQPPPQPVATQPAGWYPDPHQQARLRYWDGSQWTSNVSN